MQRSGSEHRASGCGYFVAACSLAACAAPPPPPDPTPLANLAPTPFVRGIDDQPVLDWQLESFDDTPPTVYTVADGRLRGRASAAAAMLVKPMTATPEWLQQTRPILTWSWRAVTLPDGADLTKRAGDDAVARVYVTFAYDPEHAPLGERLWRSMSARRVPGSAVCYVWANDLPTETTLPNAYADRVQMIVVDQGLASDTGWRQHTRDVVADYEQLFGHAPPAMEGIAVMVDSDQTGNQAEAWFGSVGFVLPTPPERVVQRYSSDSSSSVRAR